MQASKISLRNRGLKLKRASHTIFRFGLKPKKAHKLSVSKGPGIIYITAHLNLKHSKHITYFDWNQKQSTGQDMHGNVDFLKNALTPIIIYAELFNDLSSEVISHGKIKESMWFERWIWRWFSSTVSEIHSELCVWSLAQENDHVRQGWYTVFDSGIYW